MAIIDVDKVAGVVEKFKQLRPLVESVYPGYTLLIASKETDLLTDFFPSPHPHVDSDANSFQSLSGVKQIVQIMQEAAQPISKKAILSELKRRGSKVGYETLTSYLSKNPCFAAHSRGVWKLAEKGGG